MSVKHTPGPWRVFQTKGEPPFCIIGIGQETGEGITDGNVGLGIWDADSPEAFANAHLIAASPDLLAALKLADTAITLVISGRPESEHPPTNIGLAAVRDKIRDAIAKAEGKAP